MKIHPSAMIDPQAELASDVEVQPYTIIGPHVRIASGAVIGPHSVIDGRTEIGKNTVVYSGAQIGVICQDLKHKKGLIGRAKIGDNCIIREHVTISASTMSTYDDDHRQTSLGNGCLLMAYAHVAHDCHLGNDVFMANCASLAGHVDIEDKAIISGLVGIHQECVIGKMSFISGLTRVVKDVPPFMIVEGNPPRCCGPNNVGLRRNGISKESRVKIKTIYKIMYRMDLNTTQALHEIETAVQDCDERAHFLDFVRKSIRGITR